MTSYELRPAQSKPKVPDADQLSWGSPGDGEQEVHANVDPWLREVGSVSSAGTDLARLAVGTYIADRLTRRPARFSRQIGLHVQMIDPHLWEPLLPDVADLLSWLSGDTWLLEVSKEARRRKEKAAQSDAAEMVALFSGGLDSFCGAVLADPERSLRLIAHGDNPTIKGAQNRAWAWVSEHGAGRIELTRIALTQRSKKRESSSRSRSLLFLALAIAAADAAGTTVVEAPENGFTSLNLPLSADRGGALSTRSTHPITLARFNSILEELGVATRVSDPYSDMTKGEFLARAAAAADDTFPQGAAATLSCGKLDGARYKGGNPNLHCGLCVPCIVRRGAFISAGVTDQTIYLSSRLQGDARRKLLTNRADDVRAVQWAVERGVDDVALFAAGPYPEGFDLDRAVDLCERGLAEMAAVPLP